MNIQKWKQHFLNFSNTEIINSVAPDCSCCSQVLKVHTGSNHNNINNQNKALMSSTKSTKYLFQRRDLRKCEFKLCAFWVH